MREGAGLLIVDFAGSVLDAEDRELLAHPLVAGAILFARNYESRRQLAALCADLHALRRREPLLVTVDHEGGRVQRFRDGFTALPPAAGCGDEAGAMRHGRTLASELLAVGVDLSFAPVLDIGRGPGSVIGDRALGADAATVARLGTAWIAGVHAAGMAACAKHYPGHGGVAGDSHHELPVDERPAAAIERDDGPPFAAAVAAGVDAVMMAHVAYPAVDARPASLSPVWIGERLRARLGFDGAVVCDDLSMAGAAGFGSYPDRARAALAAGCDLLPVCNRRDGVVEVVDALAPRADASRAARVARLRPGPRA